LVNQSVFVAVLGTPASDSSMTASFFILLQA